MSCSNFNPDVPSTSVTNSSGPNNRKNTAENEDGKKSVTVLISDTGEITYDEETLQSIIGWYTTYSISIMPNIKSIFYVLHLGLLLIVILFPRFGPRINNSNLFTRGRIKKS